jgi:two-component system invasion response regulator UvrY
LHDFRADPANGLSARELEVLRLLTQGHSMGLNPKTVANHQSLPKQKLGADTAIRLVQKASARGLILPAALTMILSSQILR